MKHPRVHPEFQIQCAKRSPEEIIGVSLSLQLKILESNCFQAMHTFLVNQGLRDQLNDNGCTYKGVLSARKLFNYYIKLAVSLFIPKKDKVIVYLRQLCYRFVTFTLTTVPLVLMKLQWL